MIPRLSLFISQRNAGKKAVACIDSVLSQTFTDYEVFLFDDHSSSGHYDAIIPHTPDLPNWHVKFRLDRRHGKLGNFLSCEFRGDIIVELDGDDRLIRDDALAIIAAAYENPHVGCTVGSHRSGEHKTTPVTHAARGHRMEHLHFAAACPAPRTWLRTLSKAGHYIDMTSRPYLWAADAALFLPAFVHADTVVSIPEVLVEVDRDGPFHDYVEAPEEQARCQRALRLYWEREDERLFG